MVVELLVKMGYGGSIPEAGKAIGKSGRWTDGVIRKTGWGWTNIHSSKKWAIGNNVGSPDIQGFIGHYPVFGEKRYFHHNIYF